MHRRDAVRALVSLVPVVGAACTTVRRTAGGVGEADGAVDPLGPTVRLALAPAAAAPVVGASGTWRVLDADGRGDVVLRAGAGERWTVEQRGGRLRVVRADGAASGWRAGPLVVRAADPGALVTHDGRRYRGELALLAAGATGVLVLNRLPLEEYLRGVVPLEIGNRPPAERAAAEAQAVAARSYARARLRGTAARPFDLGVGTGDQVYGGVAAERPTTDAAVRGTAGLVLTDGGRAVSAPYHSTCGGSTAESTEVWRARSEPHLQRVSDRRPAGGAWCDAAPRYRWTATFAADELRRTLDRHLGAYATVPPGGVGEVLELRVWETTPSGRVGELMVRTARGTFHVRGNDIRSVLRPPGGGTLNSTYFTVRNAQAARGDRAPIATLEGQGYGHGVGMCQWGAIGRARAGHDFRTILRSYYPGTTVGYAG